MKSEDEGLTDINADVRDHQKAVFDHLFHKAPNKFNEVQKSYDQDSK